MCQLMITVTTAEGKPQHLWVQLPDPADTFQVVVASAGQTTTRRFDGHGRPIHAHVLSFTRRPVQHRAVGA